MIGGRKPLWSDTQPEGREKKRRDTTRKRKRETGGEHQEGLWLSAKLELQVQVVGREGQQRKGQLVVRRGPRRTTAGCPKRTHQVGRTFTVLRRGRPTATRTARRRRRWWRTMRTTCADRGSARGTPGGPQPRRGRAAALHACCQPTPPHKPRGA